MKLTNIQMESMLNSLKPLLSRRDKIGYIAARNTGILSNTLIEYFKFKYELLEKYGEVDKEGTDNNCPTMSITPDSTNFDIFIKEFEEIATIEQDVEILTLPYKEAIGNLSGEEILKLDWMFTE